MPPKKQQQQPKKNTQKAVEDKTFGLKNKNKSSKVKNYVQQVQQAANQAVAAKSKQAALNEDKAARKKLEDDKKAELAELFKPVQVQRVPFGVDPKSVVCDFFKRGVCQKGVKCKFSHDLNIERKGAKMDIYTDTRADKDKSDKENQDGEIKEDGMEGWDQQKLEQVVGQKHGKNKPTTTDIVCKFFLEAIENEKYGWFWECPNGGNNCKYRHALPPGFEMKTKREQANMEVKVEMTIEEWLEQERHKLGKNLTPITLETFNAWKQKRKEAANMAASATLKERESAYRSGKGVVTGRELFSLDPKMADAGEDEEGAWDASYKQQDDANNMAVDELNPATESTLKIDDDLFADEDLDS